MSRMSTTRTASSAILLVIICGCIIAAIGFGPRSSMGLFTAAFSTQRDWSIEIFSTAIAIQNLLWGLAQPFCGALADRFGVMRVLWGGAILYALGLLLMASAESRFGVTFSAGVLIGLGLAGSSFNLVLAAFGKLLPPQWRSLAFGLGAASGSFGQFLFAPLTVGLNATWGWQTTLLVFAALVLLILPLSLALKAGPSQGHEASGQSFPLRQALAQAFAHRSYRLLVSGFFVCGFHLAFITIHLPKYLFERGLPVEMGGYVLAGIGLFNILGSVLVGVLGSHLPRRYILFMIYSLRAVAIGVFLLVPVTSTSALIFACVMGVLWLSTVPPTNALVLLMFGPRYVATLYGIAFLSHQVGAFLALVLAGWLREATGDYTLVWMICVVLGVLAGLIHLPIVERPAPTVPQGAA